MSISDAAPAGSSEEVCSLPVVGSTTVEDALFYVAIGIAGAAGWLAWPTAGFIASGHALHQRARNVHREGVVEEARDALIEAVDDVI